MSAEPEAAPAPAESKKNGKERNRPRDETPIEDMYDLSKPIPKVERPNKVEYEKELQELTDAIEVIKEDRRKIQEKIDEAMNDPEGKASLQAARAKFNELRTEKNQLIDQKKAMFARLDSFKTQADKLVKDKKDTRSYMKFTNMEEIDKELAKLQRIQETTTMSLNEEKRLIKEMDALQASKKYVAELKDKDAAMDSVKEQRKAINAQISAKDKEIDAVSKELDQVMATIKEHNDKDSKKKDELSGLFKQRDDYKKQIGAKLKEKDAIRDAFREKNNAWFNNQRAVKAQKKMQYEEEKKKREEERAAHLAKIEAEEAKKIPYEEEQALCEFLADYLERTYLKKGGDDGKDDSKKDVVEVKDDPFAGLKPVTKKDEDEEYFGKGKGKKKRNRQTKKQDSVAGPFTLSVDTFEQFGLLNLTPPTSSDQVENSVKELREKKEWYKQQPRGSVPTAMEIRKASEKAAAKLRQSNGGEKEEPKSKGKGNFSLSNEDFVPLGAGGAASSVNSSWGQKPAVSAPAEEQAAAL